MSVALVGQRAVRKWPCENGRPVGGGGGLSHTKEAFVDVQ